MEEIMYRALRREECERIKEMNPSQYIGKAWREVSGKLQLVEIDYSDTDWPNGYKHHYDHLRQTIINDGFATLDPKFFGEKFKYVLLDQLFISLEHRVDTPTAKAMGFLGD